VPERYNRIPNTKCKNCSKPIYRRPSEIECNGNRVFCSMVCYGKSNRKEVPCLVCDTLILATFNKKTCSRSCANIHRTGIKYRLNSPKDKVKSVRAIKIKLLAIRGNTCERCKYSKHEILQVHHKNRNRTDNNLDNLELICPNCHYEEHFLEKTN
jgi:hypothetical protein